MNDSIDVITENIITLAADCKFSAPEYSDVLKFRKQLKILLLNELTYLKSTNESESKEKY